MSTRSRALAANVLLAAASVAIALALLALIEVGLRIAGQGAPRPETRSRLAYQHLRLPVLRPAVHRDGTQVWIPADPRLPYQWIRRAKPADGLRVFTFGGSATAGLGFSPNVTFARHLERLLRAALPERQVEVMNLGIVALSSDQVKLLVDEVCRRYEPDVVVVYSGNNEFLEPHAELYAAAKADVFSRFRDALMQTHLHRSLSRTFAGPATPALPDTNAREEQRRLTQAAIIREISMSDARIADVIDQYEHNLDEMAASAAHAGAELVLMTVASNWRWRGRDDLPAEWLSDLLGTDANPDDPAQLERAISVLGERIEAADATERHEWLFQRAVAAELAGDSESARADYRAAMNADPHLRRALDAMNERVRAVAARRDALLVDLPSVLARTTPEGIVGFGEFYDYVHFTPTGAVRTGAAVLDALVRAGVVEDSEADRADAYVRTRAAMKSASGSDPPELDEWIGVGGDSLRIEDRDLWKYESLLAKLDARIRENPSDFDALVHRGNYHYFRLGGGADAARDYRAALAVSENAAVRANLDRLVAEGRD